ncbi:hypothetical protein SINU_02990 [Sporolactobacillus inulinus CASD]|uniref:EamA domain-containing protein n=1 Tax=Sporolactobacillus inulinus CASD TaxID=1069536 RepID=A0A0U1QRH6_9BACL|nr:DMT family transporter [Sporolactobacillus inulinus]KLI03420.1 hypothetical protein SINU_02990 [Sporolactobacillus inulinus CASD]
MSQHKADLILVLVTMFLGSSYIFMKIGMESLAVFNLIALRFLVAFVAAAILFFRVLGKFDVATMVFSMIQSVLLLGVFSFIMYGMKTVSTSKAGFLVSLTVVFVPLVHACIVKKLPGRRALCGTLIALLGIYVLTGSASIGLSAGSVFLIIGALFNAIYIEFTGRIIHCVNLIPFSIYQMGFVAVVAFVFSAAFERPHLPDSASVWISVLGLGLLCSAAGYLLQAAAQRYTTSLHAGLIFTLEPIFAVFFAFLADGEQMSFHEYVGAVLVLASLVIMELKPRFLQHIKGGFRARITQIKTKFSRFVAKI